MADGYTLAVGRDGQVIVVRVMAGDEHLDLRMTVDDAYRFAGGVIDNCLAARREQNETADEAADAIAEALDEPTWNGHDHGM